MRYKPVYMPGVSYSNPPWFDTEEEAWEWITKRGCRFYPELSPEASEPCEMCDAEWSVFTEDEINEIENDDQVS